MYFSQNRFWIVDYTSTKAAKVLFEMFQLPSLSTVVSCDLEYAIELIGTDMHLSILDLFGPSVQNCPRLPWLALSRRGCMVLYIMIVVLQQCAQATDQGDPVLAARISRYWSGKKKSYLIIAASNPHRAQFPPLTFVDEDAKQMKVFFENLNYHPLQDPIIGDDASYDNIQTALDSIHHGHNENEVIVVYFSGHGRYGPQDRDVLLVVNGSEMHLSDWVRTARGGTADQPSYKGQLVFILDACDSGNGVWRTDLLPAELQLPTVIIASSTVDERSLQRLDSNVSAFSSVIRQAVTTDWAIADADGDGFLEYRELKQYASRALHDLYTTHKLMAQMHPEGNTDGPFYLHYDGSKDQRPTSYEHYLFETEDYAPEVLSNKATVLSAREDSLVPPTIPGSLSSMAAKIPDDVPLPDLALGYKALAKGQFTQALDYFRRSKASNASSSYKVAAADLGIARTKLFAGDYKNAFVSYDLARLYFGNDSATILAECGVTAALSGDLDTGAVYLNYANYIASKVSEPSGVGATIVKAVYLPFRALVGVSARQSTDVGKAESLRILQSLAVVAARQNNNVAKSQLFDQSVSLSSTLAKSQSPENQRIAALGFANAAELRTETGPGNFKAALSLYERADTLFEKLGDTSLEYASMLQGYAQALDNSNKPILAAAKRLKATKQIESTVDIFKNE